MKKNDMIKILEEAIDDSLDFEYNTGTTYDYEGILKRLQKEGLLISEEESENIEFRRMGER